MSSNSRNYIQTEEALVDDLLSAQNSVKEAAWAFVYKLYYPMIRDFILKNNGAESDAVDIFQDSLMILHRNLHDGVFRQEATIKTYIFSICRNLWYKEVGRRTKIADAALNIDDGTVSSADREYLISVEVVALLMNELSESCRKILTEFYYNRRTIEELKGIFNVNSSQAAKNKKYRCLGYLSKMVKERTSITLHNGNSNE